MVRSKLTLVVGMALLAATGAATGVAAAETQASWALTWRMSALERRMQSLERELRGTRERVTRCEANLATAQSERRSLEGRLALVEQGDATGLREDFDTLSATVEGELTVFENRLGPFESRLGAVEADRSALTDRFIRIEGRTKELESMSLQTSEVLACMPPLHETYSYELQCWQYGRFADLGHTPTRQRCEDACVGDQSCIGFNFRDPALPDQGPPGATSNCFLFTDCEGKGVGARDYSGWSTTVLHRDCRAVDPTISPRYYTLTSMECFGGEGYDGPLGASLERCEQACDSSPRGCVGVAWERRGEGDPAAPNCWLIESCSRSVGATYPSWATACLNPTCTAP